MRQLTDSERKARDRAWKSHFEDDPEMASFIPFEAGFTAGHVHSADRIAALEAENGRLREALQQIADGNPSPPGGQWLSDSEMAMIARRALG